MNVVVCSRRLVVAGKDVNRKYAFICGELDEQINVCALNMQQEAAGVEFILSQTLEAEENR